MTSSTNATNPASAFVVKFFKSPKGNSSEQIKAKLRHWIEVGNSVEQMSPGYNRFEIAALRRNARENARKLATRHPQIAEELMRESTMVSDSEVA
jgi:hypothetical protein